MSSPSAEFCYPPLDGSLTVDQMYEWHRVHSTDAQVFTFSNENKDLDPSMSSLTWKELGDAIARGVGIIEKSIIQSDIDSAPSDDGQPIVVGILTTSDIITYTAFLFSHLRLTHPAAHNRPLLPFPISPRNSPSAVSHLIAVTGAKYLWVTDGSMKTIVNQALEEGGLEGTTILPMPSFSDLYSSTSLPETSRVGDTVVSLEAPALILHSSGSTAFPKTRTLSHRILFEWSRVFEQGELKGLGKIMSAHASPVYHATGVLLSCWASVTGYIRCVPSPHIPFVPVTPEYLIEEVERSKSTFLVVVPSFLEAWSRNPNNIKTLRNLKAILWGGALLRPDIGKFLFEEGVPIQDVFGATEFGIVSVITNEPNPEGYEWFKFLPHIIPTLIPDTNDQETFELAFKASSEHHTAVLNTEIDGTPAYATNDVIEQHPTNAALYRIRGRKDDQIMLSTGEKTNPGPLESIIMKDAHVKNAIMFGRGRFQNGIIIEPESYDESQRLGLENYRTLIWPSIEKANSFAPAHSRIFKEMIIIASRSKPFKYTDKRSVKRGATVADYDPEIDALYRLVEDSSQVDIPSPAGSIETGGWELDEAVAFVDKVVNKFMEDVDTVRLDDDIFGLGCDSLKATYIRNTLLRALRSAIPPSSVQNVPSNFVYQHPTIRSLALYLATITRSGEELDLDPERARIERLESMVKKYTDWETKPSGDVDNEIMLLTGSTGALGSQLLAQLLLTPSVSQIYALNRPARDGRSSLQRHVEAFMDRGNDVALLHSSKITFLEGDTSVEGFAIDPDTYKKIRDSVTTIIHNAWRVDFNISLASFEPAIRGVKLLIDFALKSPRLSLPRVMFTSSVGNVQAWSEIPSVSEDPLTDLSIINTSGYSESKWVSERILLDAGKGTAVRPIVVRVGQLCGGVNGNWNAREWFPALVRASQVVGGVPDNQGLVSFLPLHVAAAALIESRHTPHNFVHLVHPRPITWTTMARHIADSLNLPVIPYDEWLERLESSPTTDEALHNNPALHLLGFYQASRAPQEAADLHKREVMGIALYETTRTTAEAPSLRPENLPQLGKDDVESWIGYWTRKGNL